MQTYMPKKGDIDRAWHVLDADGRVVGRVASRVALILMGKHTPKYTPHADMGDFVVIVNAEKARFTGNKEAAQTYYHYTGYPGGLRARNAARVRETKPEDLLRLAIRRMLPKTRMGRQMIRKLKIYAGPEHPHAAQQPQALEL